MLLLMLPFAVIGLGPYWLLSLFASPFGHTGTSADLGSAYIGATITGACQTVLGVCLLISGNAAGWGVIFGPIFILLVLLGLFLLGAVVFYGWLRK